MKIVKEDPSLGTNGIAEAQRHRGVPSRVLRSEAHFKDQGSSNWMLSDCRSAWH